MSGPAYLDVGGTPAAVYQITVDGKDVTSNFDPVLISLAVTLYDGGQADTVEFELDDTGGQIPLPRVGATVAVSLGWAYSGAVHMFDGFTDEPTSRAHHKSVRHGGGAVPESSGSALSAGGRSRGRALSLAAKSFDPTGKLKAEQQGYIDNGTLGDAVKKWGEAAGLSEVVISPELAAIKRPYWSIANETFLAWGMRMARENGATFKIMGSRGVFTSLSGGTSASGAALGTITATWGENLLDWSITPLQARPVFKAFRARHYDPVAALWKIETAPAVGGIGSDFVAEKTLMMKSAREDVARAAASSAAAASANAKGSADSVVIDGDPMAQPEAPCLVAGVRPGVDGAYLISRVRHELRRSSGFVTSLGLKQPTGSAGTDGR